MDVLALKPLNEKSRKIIADAGDIATHRNRIRAIKMCGSGLIHQCLGTLVENLKERNIEIQNYSITSLALLRLKESIPFLKEAVQNIRSEIQEEEKRLTDLQERRQQDALTKQKEKIFDLYINQGDMLWAIGMTREKSESTYLLGFLQDKNPYIRASASLGVSFLRDETTQTTLETALRTEREEKVIIELLRALLVLMPVHAAHTKQVASLLASKDPAVRKTAADVIVQFHIREASQPLERALLLEEDTDTHKRLFTAYQTLTYY